MGLPEQVVFFRRTFPSANMVLVRGSRPVLVDTGFGSDLPETERLLAAAGVPPARLHLIVNTHYHCDHVGGNSGLQQRYGLPIATFASEGRLVNRRDPQAGAAEWLDQPIEPYRVDRPLAGGDCIDAGGLTLQVLHTPGHTRGHISLYVPEAEVLICGDAVHGDDVGWISIFTEGPSALDHALASLDRLAALPVRRACSGHGPAIDDLPAAIDTARRRYSAWQADPQRLAWHACKRIFAYHLMLVGGLPEAAVAPYLLQVPWFPAFSRHYFALEPADFVPLLLQEMLRSGAAGWREGRLLALTPYNQPPAGWPPPHSRPRLWPR